MLRLEKTFLIVLLLMCASAARAQDTEYASADAPEFLFMGFGDISYISKDGSNEDGFVVGQAVGHMVASLSDSFTVFGEASATAKDSEYKFEIERFIVKYDFSDYYKLSAGRYHTPIGYWNSAFHHGAWLQTSIGRPGMLKFGSKLVPIHFVGVLLEGSLPSGKLGLDYKAGFGNGRHENIARAGDAGDLNGDKAWMLQINAKPQNLYGFNAGLGFYNDEITPDGSPPIEESTVSAYAVWTKESPEFIFEYLHSTHTLVTDSSATGDVDGWYAQFAYRLPGKKSHWKPYARYEHNEIDESDPLLGEEGLDYDGGILGVRWDFNRYAALKAEYRNEEFNNGGRENNFSLQISFVLTKM